MRSFLIQVWFQCLLKRPTHSQKKPALLRCGLCFTIRGFAALQRIKHQVQVTQPFNNCAKLMAWFRENVQFPSALNISYGNFYKYFRYNKVPRGWNSREKYKMRGSDGPKYDFSATLEQIIWRMKNIGLREVEKYFARLLLLNKSLATSFSALRWRYDSQYPTWGETCSAMCLLTDDGEWIR